jgi:catechol 2,3-dioxygenase-like lactoylglutathione lyase family enzyme
MKTFAIHALAGVLFLSLPYAAVPQQPTARPHILGIAYVEVLSSNPSASRDFYSLILGSPHLGCDWCDRTPSDSFSVNGVQYVGMGGASSPAPSNLLAEITFFTDDAAALEKYFKSQKIAVRSDKAGGRLQLRLKDPEGHSLAFIQWSKDPGAKPPELKPDAQIIHAGFVVHDRAAEDKFYKDILGFRLYWHGGMKDGTDDWVDMQVPDGSSWIEYMLNVSLSADKHTLGVMNHFAVGVPDIQAAYQRLVKNGWSPSEKPKIGRDGKWQLNLYDPDDTRVEFMEFTPAEKPCCSPYTGPHPGPQQPNPPFGLNVSQLINPQPATTAQPQL